MVEIDWMFLPTQPDLLNLLWLAYFIDVRPSTFDWALMKDLQHMLD
jgi:hypothetical protein